MLKLLLRRNEVKEMLGVDEPVLAKITHSKKLQPFYVNGKGRAFYRTIDVLNIGGIKDEKDIKKLTQ